MERRVNVSYNIIHIDASQDINHFAMSCELRAMGRDSRLEAQSSKLKAKNHGDNKNFNRRFIDNKT